MFPSFIILIIIESYSCGVGSINFVQSNVSFTIRLCQVCQLRPPEAGVLPE